MTAPPSWQFAKIRHHTLRYCQTTCFRAAFAFPSYRFLFILTWALYTKPLLLSSPRQFLSPFTQRNTKLRPLSYARSLPYEDEWNEAHAGGEAAEERASTRYAKVLEHVAGGQGQQDSEEGAGHGCDRGGRGGVDVIRIGEVIEEGYEDEHEAKPEGDTGEHGDRKGDAALGGPSKPEEGNDERGAAEEREGQAAELLALSPRAAPGGGTGQNHVPAPEERKGEKGTPSNREITQAGEARGEGVELLEDDRVCLEEHVEDCVAEGEVGTCGGDDELGEEHAEGPGEDNGEELVEVRCLEIAGGDNTQRRILLAHLLGSAVEQDGAVCLGDKEDQTKGGGGRDDGDPEGPTPAEGVRAVARHDGGEKGAKKCGLREESQSGIPRLQRDRTQIYSLPERRHRPSLSPWGCHIHPPRYQLPPQRVHFQ